jgi:hypothetical protein
LPAILGTALKAPHKEPDAYTSLIALDIALEPIPSTFSKLLPTYCSNSGLKLDHCKLLNS